jgi:hypothetical protein
MTEETICQFRDGRFTNIPAPAWLDAAARIAHEECVGWEQAIGRMLDAEHEGLTVEPTGPIGLEISFWRSRRGTYVEIETASGYVEQVLIPETVDWLPFVSAHLTPLLTAVAQAQTAAELARLTEAVISFARHGQGPHVGRYSGRSQIDEERDERYRASLRHRERA